MIPQPIYMFLSSIRAAVIGLTIASLYIVTPTGYTENDGGDESILGIERTTDFMVTGDGYSDQWSSFKPFEKMKPIP